jgi:hypothetical protein
LGKENLISGDSKDGVYRATVVFPKYSKAGIYVISSITTANLFPTTSGSGILSNTLDTYRLAARGFLTQLEIISNNEDVTPAEISDFSFTPNVIDVTNGSQDVTVTIRAKDAQSGVRSVGAYFFPRDSRNGGGISISLDSSNRISGDDKDGIYRGVITFPRNTPPGIYDVYISASDGIKNGISLDPTQLAARGYSSQLKIIGPRRIRRTNSRGLGGF